MTIKIVKRLHEETKQTMFPVVEYCIDVLSNGYFYVTANEKPISKISIFSTLKEARESIQAHTNNKLTDF